VAFLFKEGVGIEDSGSRFEFTGDLDQDGFRNLSKHLRIDVTIQGERYTFVTVHLLSSNVAGCQEQARTLRAWITTEVEPDATLVVLGDFNAGQNFNQTSSGSEIGIIRGFQTPSQDDDLFDAHQLLGDHFPLVLTIAAAAGPVVVPEPTAMPQGAQELLLARLEAIEAKIEELQQEIEAIKQLIVALDE
jgi:hypothetical protein